MNPDQGHKHFFKFYSFFIKQKMFRARSFFAIMDPDPDSKNVADLTIYIG